MRRLPIVRRRKSGPIATFWLFCWRKRWHTDSKRDWCASHARRTSPSSAPSKSSTSNASQRGQLQQALFNYTHPHVLIVDEIGYLAHGQDAANVLFHVVNDRYLKKRPMIFTTNKPLSAWGKVLHDEDLAAAILDRVLERGRFIHLQGPSGRTGHQLDGQEHLPTTADGARISGIDRPKFPEPTDVGVVQR